MRCVRLIVFTTMLKVGPLSSFSLLENFSQHYGRVQQQVQVREQEVLRMRTSANAAMGSMMVASLEADLARMKEMADALKRHILVFQAQLLDPQFLATCTSQ